MNIQSLSLAGKHLSIISAGAALTGILAVFPSPVEAITLVTQRADLGGNDQIDWSSLGKVFPPTFLPNSFTATSENGLGLSVIIPPPEPGITPPLVFQTLPPPQGIPTNFAPGDFILLTGLTLGIFPSLGNPGPLSITFDNPVEGAGTQIAVDDTLSFTALIAAFDSDNNQIGAFSLPGNSSLALDNSAIFIGLLSDTPNIKRLVFSTSVPNRAIGINTLSIRSTPIPESDTVVALGLLGLGILVSQKKIG